MRTIGTIFAGLLSNGETSTLTRDFLYQSWDSTPVVPAHLSGTPEPASR